MDDETGHRGRVLPRRPVRVPAPVIEADSCAA